MTFLISVITIKYNGGIQTEDLINKLSKAGTILQQAVTEKMANLDKDTLDNIELIRSVKMEILVLAQILMKRFNDCNVSLSYDTEFYRASSATDRKHKTFQISVYGENIFVHCPEWTINNKREGWKNLNEINLEDAEKIAQYLIETSKNISELKTELQ